MAADEGRRWPADYLYGADALQHLEEHYGLRADQAWPRLLEDHERGEVELRYDLSPRSPERARCDHLETVLFVNRRADLVRVHREEFFRKYPPTTSTPDRSPPRPPGRPSIPIAELKAEMAKRAEKGTLARTWAKAAQDLADYRHPSFDGAPGKPSGIKRRKELADEYRRLRGKWG